MILDLFDRLPTLKLQRNPAVALLLGLLFGGIGLGIYLRSWLDAIFPIVVIILLSAKFQGGGVAFGAAVAGVWGCMRTVSSNRQLAAASA